MSEQERKLEWIKHKNWLYHHDKERCELEGDIKQNEKEHTLNLDGVILERDAIGDIHMLLSTYFSDWNESPIDILGAMLIFKAARRKPVKKLERRVLDPGFIQESFRFLRIARSAYSASQDQIFEQYLPELNITGYVDGIWDKSILKDAPVWYMYVNVELSEIYISLRGTKELEDLLVDLAAQLMSYRGGYCHRGFHASLAALMNSKFPDVLESTMAAHPDFKIRICGHSMGSAVALLLVIELVVKYPNKDIHGWCFACPAVISSHFFEITKKHITTYIHNFDFVARLNMAGIEDLHKGALLIWKETGGGLQAVAKSSTKEMFLKSYPTLGSMLDELRIEFEKIIMEEVTTGNTCHLFPGGDIYQMWKVKHQNFQSYEIYHAEPFEYPVVFLTKNCFKDHSSTAYQAAFESMLSWELLVHNVESWIPSYKTEKVLEYWNKYKNYGDTVWDYEIDLVVKDLARTSKYKTKIQKEGMIRPFLYLLTIHPKERAVLGVLFGFNIMNKKWYPNPHKEAFSIITVNHYGLQAKANRAFQESLNPFNGNANWSPHQAKYASCVAGNDGIKYLEELFLVMCKHCSSTDVADPKLKEEAIVYCAANAHPKSIPATTLVETFEKHFKTGVMRYTIPSYLITCSGKSIFNNIVANGLRASEENKKHDTKNVFKVGTPVVALTGLALIANPPLTIAALGVAGVTAGIGALAISNRARPTDLLVPIILLVRSRIVLAVFDIEIDQFFE